MLKESDAMATIAVRDLSRAKTFYRETLGLELLPGSEGGAVSFRSGRSTIVVYQSDYAGTNRATSATWSVPDVEHVVADLRAKGVQFEHYDLPGLTRQGDLHVHGSFRAAWFKDPDGNILHVLSM